MGIRLLLSACCLSLASVSTSTYASLMGRGTDLVFDDDLGITWLADANLADTFDFGVTGVGLDGSMTWNSATEWITAMNNVANPDGSTGYLGFTGWRLPTTVQPDPSCSRQTGDISYGFGCSGSEMGHLFYTEGISSASPGSLFRHVQADYSWSGTEFDASNAWIFNFETGEQAVQDKSSITFKYYAWAVHEGDIGVVPVPAAVWLFASGLLGLVGFARRKS